MAKGKNAPQKAAMQCFAGSSDIILFCILKF